MYPSSTSRHGRKRFARLVTVLALCALVTTVMLLQSSPVSASSQITFKTLYGDPVLIRDLANTSAQLLPTGVNDSGVVAAEESFGTGATVSSIPVAFTTTGKGSATTAKVTPLRPPATSKPIGGIWGYSAGISNAGSLYGTASICPPTRAVCEFHAMRWSTSGTPTDLGFGAVTATSPGDAIGGTSALDTGTQAKSGSNTGDEIYDCGVYTHTGGTSAGLGSLTPLAATASHCFTLGTDGPYYDLGNGLVGLSSLLGVNDSGVGLAQDPNGSDYTSTLGTTLTNYCAVQGGTLPTDGPLVSSSGLVIGEECNGGSENTGAVWNASTGDVTALQGINSASDTWPSAITANGEILGHDDDGAAMWTSSGSPPVQISNVGWPVDVSGNGQYLVTQSSSAGGPFVLYRSVTAPPPHLSESITFPNSPGGIPSPNPGETISADVTVATGAGDGNLKDLTFENSDPLQVDPSGAFSVVTGPSPPVTGPLTMAPNSIRQFTYKLKPKKLGTATLSTNVRGAADDGTPVSASDQTTVVVGVSLQVDLSYTPKKIKVPVDDKGADIPRPFSLKVTVTNPFNKTLQNVRLEKLPIVEKMGADIAVPIEQNLKKKQPDVKLGTLTPHEDKSITFPFLADTDGQGRVSWTAYATNPDNAKDTIKGAGSTVVSIDPTVIIQVRLSLRPSGGTLVTSGDLATAGLVLTNVTNGDVVQLDPLDPELTGNAGGGNPIDADNPPPADAYPLSASPKLGPAEVKALTADIFTVQSEGTRGTVKYHVTGKVEKPDGSDANVSDSEVLYDPKDATEPIHIDDSVPPYDPNSKLKSAVANYSIGFAEGEIQWLESTYDTVAWLLKSAPRAILAVSKAPLQLLQSLDYTVTYWGYLTPSAREQWYTEIATGILAQTVELGKTLLEVKAKVKAAVSSWMDTLQLAWDTGDYDVVARQAGKISGNIALEAASWSIHLPKAADLIKLGDAAKEANVTKRVAAGLKALQAGDDLTKAGQALSKLYGLTIQQIEALQLLAKEKGLLIAARTRNPLSIQWEKLGALLKPEAIKIKNVDEIDAAFLGYRKVDEGSVVFKKPVSPTELESSKAYQSAPMIQQKAAQARLKTRTKEWSKYETEYRNMARPLDQGGGVDVASTIPPTEPRSRRRRLSPRRLPLLSTRFRAREPTTTSSRWRINQAISSELRVMWTSWRSRRRTAAS